MSAQGNIFDLNFWLKRCKMHFKSHVLIWLYSSLSDLIDGSFQICLTEKKTGVRLNFSTLKAVQLFFLTLPNVIPVSLPVRHMEVILVLPSWFHTELMKSVTVTLGNLYEWIKKVDLFKEELTWFILHQWIISGGLWWHGFQREQLYNSSYAGD